VRVADAKGQPPTLPFWLARRPAAPTSCPRKFQAAPGTWADRLDDPPARFQWLVDTIGLTEPGARLIVDTSRRRAWSLAPSPTQKVPGSSVLDERGGMQLVLHAPFAAASTAPGGWRCASASAAASTSTTSCGDRGRDSYCHSDHRPSFFFRLRGRCPVSEAPDRGAPAGAGDARRASLRTRWVGTRRARSRCWVPRRPESPDTIAAQWRLRTWSRPCSPISSPGPRYLVGGREIPDHPLVNQTIARLATGGMELSRG